MFVKSKANVCFCKKKKNTFSTSFFLSYYSRFFSLFCLFCVFSFPFFRFGTFFFFNFPEINKIVERIFRRIYFDVRVVCGRKKKKENLKKAEKKKYRYIVRKRKYTSNAILIMFIDF